MGCLERLCLVVCLVCLVWLAFPHYDLDGALAVDFPADVEGPATAFGYRGETGLVRFELPYRGREGRVLQGLGDGREEGW